MFKFIIYLSQNPQIMMKIQKVILVMTLKMKLDGNIACLQNIPTSNNTKSYRLDGLDYQGDR